jgi:hypothetical protein
MWEISGLNVSRRPMVLYGTLHARDGINRADTTIFNFQKMLVFKKLYVSKLSTSDEKIFFLL